LGMHARRLRRCSTDSKLLSVDWLDPLGQQLSIWEKPQQPRIQVQTPTESLKAGVPPPKILPAGRARGKAVMDALYDLRHAGNPNVGMGLRTEDSEEVKRRMKRVPSHKIAKNPGEDLTLLEFTLVDCSDTPEQLHDGVNLISKGRCVATDLGSTRHPTMLGASRAFQVIKRKLEVLEPLVLAIRQFNEISTRKQEIVKAIEAGAKPEDVAPQAIMLNHLLEDSVHERPYGAPHEADRLDWEVFVSTFKLPKNHLAFYQAEAAVHREQDEWMDLVLDVAMHHIEEERSTTTEASGASPASPAAEVARRLFLLMDGCAIPSDNPRLVKTEMLAEAQKCRRLLAHTKHQAREVEGNTSARTLREVAERLNGICLDAIEWGVKKNHPDIAKALEITQKIRARGVYLFAAQLMSERRCHLGEAEDAAKEVEAAVREAQAFGCSLDLEHMEAARKLSTKLREEEGLRKRQANSDKRYSEAHGLQRRVV